MSDYFVLYVTEDGDVFFELYEADALESHLNEHYWGEDVTIRNSADGDVMMGHGNSLLIVKGEIIVPKERTVVTEFALD